MKQESVNKLTVLLLVTGVSVVFAIMIRGYLMTLLLAGVLAALSQPLFRRILSVTGDRRTLASILTLLVILLMVIIPLAIVLSIVVVQAVQVGQAVGPWIQRTVSQPAELLAGLESLPFYEYLAQYQDDVVTGIGNLVSSLSSLLVNSASQLTSSTVQAVFLFFIFLYAAFFFMKDGEKLIDLILYYLPLEDEPERKLLDHFTSVSRATLKGTLLIGLIQGVLAGLGFWVAGINSVMFWGLVMTVLSIIPLIGSSLVWIPAVAILAVSGRIGAAVGLGLYCAILVGSIDNILRPILVGKDTKMHELFILLSTLGGIGLFGIWGVLIGPVIAALFVSIWDLYGKTFAEYLPAVITAADRNRPVPAREIPAGEDPAADLSEERPASTQDAEADPGPDAAGTADDGGKE
jgi:predicted PurR-regulated permease PerM